MLQLKVNGQQHALDIDPDTPLLWALRDHLQLQGTKYGCGIGLCGSCTVHIDDRAVRACLVTVGEVSGKSVTTIEGLAPDSGPVQQAWREFEVPTCGAILLFSWMAVLSRSCDAEYRGSMGHREASSPRYPSQSRRFPAPARGSRASPQPAQSTRRRPKS